jgi:GTPase
MPGDGRIADRIMLAKRAGFVAVVGKPNVGKSTLINALLGQKVTAVSPKPQTTRRNQLGILTMPEVQIIFTDTPGLHEPRNKLGKWMNEEAMFALKDSDVVLFIVDASETPTVEDKRLAEAISAAKGKHPVLLALNKIDKLSGSLLEARRSEYGALQLDAKMIELSALTGTGVQGLLKELIGFMPEGDFFYPEDQVTDFFERQIAADLIREAALENLRDEVPHGIAVRIDQFTERGDSGALIEATIFVERDSHKGIVIGQGGAMIKTIGKAARREIEAMSGRKVFLDLRVKVEKDWRDEEKALKRFGYARGARE